MKTFKQWIEQQQDPNADPELDQDKKQLNDLIQSGGDVAKLCNTKLQDPKIDPAKKAYYKKFAKNAGVRTQGQPQPQPQVPGT